MRRNVALAALTACAGGMDLLSVAVLGGVFSGVITGNLVHAGHGAGSGHWHLALTAAGAVASFTAGVALASFLLGAPHTRTPRRMRVVLALLTGAVLVFAGAWALVGARPSAVLSPVLLAGAALAMGAQSGWARAAGASTTYLTGTLTAAVHDAATGGGLGHHRWALIRLACLAGGAVLTTLALLHCAPAAALVPAGLSVAGAALWWR